MVSRSGSEGATGKGPMPVKAAQEELEDERLQQLGVHRELRREFSTFSAVSFAIGAMGITATIASTFNTPILSGGRAAAVWSWLLGCFGCLAIAASVAELVSAYPTAGGVYTSTAFVIPPRYRASVTFVSAWMTLLGQLTAQSSIVFALSEMIFAAVTIGTDGRFIASVKEIYGVYVGLTIVIGVLNSMPTKVLHNISFSYIYVNVLVALAVIIAVPASGRGQLASSKSVWIGITDNSGWNNNGFAFLLGLLCVQYVMTDYDAVAHISEEIRNAAVVTPIAIIIAVAITGILGFFIVISLCYGIRDISALPGPTGLVFSQILWDNLGRKGGLALWVCVVVNQAMLAITCQLACIRSIYAISRDNALPDRRLFSKVWSKTKTPVNAAILTVVVVVICGLLSLASLVAINAIFSATAVALDLSYIIPVVAKVCISFQKDPDIRFTPGPFYMGRWSIIVNIYAITWTCLESGVLIMPQVFPVTASTMNYAAPILVGVCGLSWIWYMVYWHREYTGPAGSVVTIHSSVNDSASSEEKHEKTQIDFSGGP
ncbi:hypothetical protein M0805_002987 [Coniferiporia weirii]|nr:hypothetical protein M0805_002987 [Coniferiporia weirii]